MDLTPTIINMNPRSGATGSVVTIYGTKFDLEVGEIRDGWYIDYYGFTQLYSSVKTINLF